MFVAASSLLHGFLHDAPSNSLMVGGNERQPLWIVGNGEERGAIFLSDVHRYQWHSMPATDNYDWQGAILAPVRLEVDPTRVGDAYDSKNGSLRCVDGKLSVKVISSNSIQRTFWLHISEAPGVKNEAYYSRWRLVIGENKEALTLVQYDSGTASFPGLDGCSQK